MTHDSNLLYTLAGGLGAALFFGFATQKLKLSPIVGYLLAGIAVGPHTPGFVAHGAIAAELAELGVILLMFGVGLHFHIEDLLSVRKAVLPGAVLQVVASALVGAGLGRFVGLSPAAGAVAGLAVSTASTVVVLRVLTDASVVQKPEGHVVVGWLLVQDVATVLVLVLLPVVAGNGKDPVTAASVVKSSAIAIAKLVALGAFTAVVGRRAIPRLLGYVAKTRSRELFTLTVLVLALGIAVGSALLFGASMALGAFLAGVVVGQSTFAARAASEAMPMKDAFAVLFFVSVGMMLDPAAIWPNRGLVALLTAIVMVVNPLVAYVAARVRKTPLRTAVTLGLSLGQIGEFSFMLGTLGHKVGLLPGHVLPCLVAVSILTITLNPLIFKLVESIVHALEGRRTLRPALADLPDDGSKKHHAVVVGYGPVGRTLVKLLAENGVVPTVIEMNHETVARLTKEGVRAVYGDAARKEILESAGIASAESLVVAASGSPAAVIDAARAENPKLRVLSRATYLSEVGTLTALGASQVVTAEGEVALAMAETILSRLGATPEQLDKARDRLRTELVEDVGPASRGLDTG